LDLLLWWLGDVTNFEYYDDNYGGIEADCKIILELESGAKGFVELSRTRNLRNTAIIQGEFASIEVDLRRNWAKISSPDNKFALAGCGLASDLPGVTEQGFKDLFQPQLEDWIASIQGKHPSRIGIEARRSIALIEACYAKRKQLEVPWI
jgi:hypothetical protein